METGTRPSTREDFKRPFFSELKVQGNTGVTFCHFLLSRRYPAVVRNTCIHPEESERPTSLHSRVVARGHPVNTVSSELIFYKEDIVSAHATLTVIVFDSFSLVCSLESQFPISCFSYLATEAWLSTPALFQRHLASHLHSDTLSSHGSFPVQPGDCAAPLEQMGLRNNAVQLLAF